LSRPRKVILLLGADEHVNAQRQYLLEMRAHFRCMLARSGELGLNILSGQIVDAVVCDWVLLDMDGNEFCRRAAWVRPDLGTLLISEQVRIYERGLHATLFLPAGALSPASLLESLRPLALRKRGPKKSCLDGIYQKGIPA
jgi:hypothetical protein